MDHKVLHKLNEIRRVCLAKVLDMHPSPGFRKKLGNVTFGSILTVRYELDLILRQRAHYNTWTTIFYWTGLRFYRGAELAGVMCSACKICSEFLCLGISCGFSLYGTHLI